MSLFIGVVLAHYRSDMETPSRTESKAEVQLTRFVESTWVTVRRASINILWQWRRGRWRDTSIISHWTDWPSTVQAIVDLELRLFE